MINPHVICRETEDEAWAQYNQILDQADPIALENFVATFMGGDQFMERSFEKQLGGRRQRASRRHTGTDRQLVHQVKESRLRRHADQFFDFLPDLDFFGKRVMPLLHQAGLRIENA